MADARRTKAADASSPLTGRASLAERMSRVARDLQDAPDPAATIRAAAILAEANVRGCDAAALSMIERHGRIETQAYTDEIALGGDLLQYTLGEGPCLTAVWEERVVHSTDLAADPRWPAWGPRVASQYGVHSILCFQLFNRADALGALNLYSRRRAGFDEQDLDDGLALSTHIAIAVTVAQKTDQLTRALDSRTLIGQAVGVVMERYQLDATAAFQVLARISSETNSKILEIARELIDTGRLPGTAERR
jgi:transcriptional regulator with GAF, ATPase, and Fis domain